MTTTITQTMTKLEKRFPNAKGYKTREGAEAKLARHLTLLHDFSVLHFAFRRPCGSWIPVAILNDHNEHLGGPLASRGICVTKA